MRNSDRKLRELIREELLNLKRAPLSEGLQYHIANRVPVDDNVYRPGTREFFAIFNEARELYRSGLYEATDAEAELLESDIGEWALFEGRMVPLDFPMWDESLNEDYADHYPKDSWEQLTKSDIAKNPEIADEIIDIVNLSYADIGGHANYKRAEDILNDPDDLLFSLIDLDDDPYVDASKIAKKTKFGLKSILSATDGSPNARTSLSNKTGEVLNSHGNYAEVSGKMANLAIKKHNAPIVSDEKTVRTVLGPGKEITWIGEDPTGYFPGVYGWYSRKIGGHEHVKIMVGLPDISKSVKEAKYKGREVVLGAKGATRSGGRAHVYVRDPKTGKVKKVSFGSGMADAMGDSEAHRKRRKSFGDRHDCAGKKDKTKAGYWACRATKMFGRNIPGWW